MIIKTEDVKQIIRDKTSDKNFWGDIVLSIKSGVLYTIEIKEKIKVEENIKSK